LTERFSTVRFLETAIRSKSSVVISEKDDEDMVVLMDMVDNEEPKKEANISSSGRGIETILEFTLTIFPPFWA